MNRVKKAGCSLADGMLPQNFYSLGRTSVVNTGCIEVTFVHTDGVHEPAKRGLVAVNSLHSRQSAESELASLKLMAQRVEQATNNIRNGMPVGFFSV